MAKTVPVILNVAISGGRGSFARGDEFPASPAEAKRMIAQGIAARKPAAGKPAAKKPAAETAAKAPAPDAETANAGREV